jgi:hypothetical protein
MKIALLAGGLWVGACFTACARSPEASAPAASSTTTAKAKERGATPESPPAAPAPAPAFAPQGLDEGKSEDNAEFSSLEAAERALNQAKADLDRLALAEPAPAVGRSASADRAEKKNDSKPRQAPSAAGAAAPTKANGMCEEACRALSSLSRAASAVCRLDSNGGTHCSHAKHVLADAQQRVASCSCVGSSD